MVATVNDAILLATGGPTVPDGLRAYYKAAGATGETLPDLERQFLKIQMPVADGTNQDLWSQYLSGAFGYVGSLADKLLQYWIGVSGLPLVSGYIYFIPDANIVLANQMAAGNGFGDNFFNVPLESTINASLWWGRFSTQDILAVNPNQWIVTGIVSTQVGGGALSSLWSATLASNNLEFIP